MDRPQSTCVELAHADHADRAYVFENGRVLTSGPARELADSPLIREAFLGLAAY